MTGEPSLTRRTVLRAGAAATASGIALGATAGSVAAAGDFDGWLANTGNYDGSVVDRTGQSTVEITVGVTGNGGPNGFGPPAVRVDPGTTVVWRWSGDGYHNVEEKGGAFASETVGEQGHTFEQTFEESGVVKYKCLPHAAMGMKGVVVVGDVDVGGSSGGGTEASGPDFGSWFEDVSNFEGVTDATGQREVTVTVGARGNNGTFAFDPPAVRVDPGTTVTWEWSGQGGVHDVVAEDGSFASETVGEQGHTFEQTFEDAGIYRYYCSPHKAMGMKGAVVVGGGDGESSGASEPGGGVGRMLALGGGVGLGGALLGMFGSAARGRQRDR